MTSSDFLCQRSMLVRWQDATGARSWSSSLEADGPEGGWYEAEKLLPSTAMHITVQFQAHGPGGPWDVCQVDRRKDCRWIAGPGGHPVEVIRLRTDAGSVADDVDVLFELAGPMHGCYLWRAWNTARAGPRQHWEHWPERETRPKLAGRPLTLEAADGAAPLLYMPGEPMVRCKCATKRLSAAAHALVDVHRQTLERLRELDARFTDQWFGVNMGTTASAGLGIASAVLLFTAPPVGVGLGIGSSVAGGLAFAGDSLADHSHLTDLKRQLSEDAFDAFVVAELLKEWMLARRALAAASPLGPGHMQREDSTLNDACDSVGGRGCSTDRLSIGEAVDNGLVAGAVADGVAVTGTRLADGLGKTIAGFSQVLGVAGALISTGFMIRGWSTTKAGQSAVRAKIRELTLRVVQLQHLVASIDRLECPVCADEIILADNVRRCASNFHCFHERCLGHQQRGVAQGCPLCGGPLDAEAELMADSAALRRPRRGPGAAQQRGEDPGGLLARACQGSGPRSATGTAGQERPRPRAAAGIGGRPRRTSTHAIGCLPGDTGCL